MNEKKSVLVIAAHPDDEVLGCGGTITRMTKEGHFVSIIILGEGITSRYLRREDADKKIIGDLHERSHAAVGLLGVKDLQIFDLPDNRFDTIPLLDIVKIISTSLEKINPDCVYTHHPADLNMDHVLTNRATLIATRPLEKSPVKTVISYEVPSSTEWSFGINTPGFQPDIFSDIAGTLETKIEALKKYDGEIRKYPHPRSAEALRAIAIRWGSVSGLEAAEAFELIRHIG